MADPIEDAHVKHLGRMRERAPRTHALFDDLMALPPTPQVDQYLVMLSVACDKGDEIPEETERIIRCRAGLVEDANASA